MERALCDRITLHPRWQTVDVDAHGHAVTQVAEIDFMRESWTEGGLSVRVIARRTREHTSGRQTALWDGLDWTTQVFLTNDPFIDAADVPFEYNGRAAIEPLIAELKQAWAIGKVPSETFMANHAMFLLKLLSHNLLRRFVLHTEPAPSANLACELGPPRPAVYPGASAAQWPLLEPATSARFAVTPPDRVTESCAMRRLGVRGRCAREHELSPAPPSEPPLRLCVHRPATTSAKSRLRWPRTLCARRGKDLPLLSPISHGAGTRRSRREVLDVGDGCSGADHVRQGSRHRRLWPRVRCADPARLPSERDASLRASPAMARARRSEPVGRDRAELRDVRAALGPRGWALVRSDREWKSAEK